MTQGQVAALISGIALLIYTSPLLLTNTSGGWDFWYIWDDRANFVENEVLQSSMSFQTLYEMFTLVKLNVYEPLGWLLKYFIVQTMGLDAWWIRMVSVVIHFGAGFILAKVSGMVLDINFMLKKFKRSRQFALDELRFREMSCLHFFACSLSAAVFLVHPIHVEVVAWPSAQPYTLAAFFSFWALFVHVKSIHLKLCELLFSTHRTFNVKQIGLYIANKLPVGAILLVFVSVTGFSNIGGGKPEMISLSVGERVLKALSSPIWIFRRFVWPSNLRPHYQIRSGDLSIGNPECLLSLATTTFILAIIIWNSWHRGVSKHMLSLVFFIVHYDVAACIRIAGANRYAYLPTAIVVPYGGWSTYSMRGDALLI
ncbi:hypothetical protein PHMEG_00029668 [Phytophthora megakarya]|uniref:Transmembrane protein n=1 Tax=Phytophthora megakarya TaxID=4795 RepID=A0A225V312_9STRA|nr:hypothetical protein PHMEG_00029668 [Phytophthora megakarya]